MNTKPMLILLASKLILLLTPGASPAQEWAAKYILAFHPIHSPGQDPRIPSAPGGLGRLIKHKIETARSAYSIGEKFTGHAIIARPVGSLLENGLIFGKDTIINILRKPRYK